MVYLMTTTAQKAKNTISKQYFRNTLGMFGCSVMIVMMKNELDIVAKCVQEWELLWHACGVWPAFGGQNDSMFPLGTSGC